jgi:hypothetical protein
MGCLPTRVRTIVLAGVMTVLSSLLSASPASAAPQWTPPEVLGLQAGNVRMDVNTAGAAVAAWSTDGGVKASYRPVGRDWQRPVVVSAVPGDLRGAFVDDRGRATVVWWNEVAETVMVADRDSAGRWRPDDDAPSPTGCCWTGTPTAEADEAGHLLLTWTVANDLFGDDHDIFWRAPDGRWKPLAEGGGSRLPVTVDGGVATFAKGGDGIYTQTSTIGERQATAWERIWPGTDVRVLAMAQNSRGDLVLAALDGVTVDNVDRPDGTDAGSLIVLTKPAGEAWREALRADAREQALFPSVAIDKSGRTGVTYRRASDGALAVRIGHVRGDSEGVPTTLSSRVGGPAPMAFNPKGDAVVTWHTDGSGDDRPVFAAHRPADGAWQEPVRIGQRDTGGLAVHAYPNGMFTALFHDDGAAMWSDHVDDTAAPTVRMTKPGPRPVLGSRMRASWTATDNLAGVRDVDVRVRSAGRDGRFSSWATWLNDTTATSAHRRVVPGRTYCFSARARDRVGNVGRWSEPRCAATPVDDRAASASSGWSETRSRAAYQRTLTTTDRRGERLVLPGVRARQIGLVARTCPACGKVTVRHGGRLLGTVDLRSPNVRNKRVFVLKTYTTPRLGTLVVHVVSSGKPVHIDGFVAKR